ncbi:MAG: class I SAM-dependent methyltransferase [Lysobacteraceae bacterium]
MLLVRRYAWGRVLDIGCADQWIRPHLPNGCDYIGLDSLKTGGALYNAKPDVFADACDLPLQDSSVDTVLMLEVLEHIRNPSKALSEVARVLRPGGGLLLTLPFLYPVHDAPHDYQRYTSHGLVRELQSVGFVVDDPVETLESIETAGLLASLALAGVGSEILQKKNLTLLALPFIVAFIPVINISCWLAGLVLPTWSALTVGYRIHGRMP